MVEALPQPKPNPPKETATVPQAERFDRLLAHYGALAKEAGCPLDQIARLASAEVFLQAKHLQFCTAARECDAHDGPTRVAAGGARGGGKSHLILAQIGVDDCQRYAGLKCLLLRKVGKAALESIQDLARKVFKRVPYVINARGVITFPNGSRIITGHFKSEKDIEAYLGLEYDVIAVEEATTLTPSKLRSIVTCCRTSKPAWRPRLYYTTNPGGVGHAYFKKEFILPWRAKKETDTRFIPFTVDDNPFIDDGYRANLDKQVGWQLRAWRHGDWDIAAGQYFSNYSEPHVVIRGDYDESRLKFWAAGLDYGFNHPTVVPLGGMDGDGNWIILDEHSQRGWLVEQHAPAIKAMIARHKKWIPHPRLGRQSVPLTVSDLAYIAAGNDCFSKESRGRTIADDYKAAGLTLTPANDDRISGAAEILKLLGDPLRATGPIKPRLFIHERCVGLINQLPEMQHDPNRPEDVLKIDIDEEGNGGDDFYDGARYLIMTRAKKIAQTKLTGV